MKVSKRLTIAIVIGLTAMAIRLPGLGEFMTADEERWMMRGIQFYNNLAANKFDETFVSTHPGATAMWLIGGGEKIQEMRLGVSLDRSNLIHFRKSATFPIAATSAILIGSAAWLMIPLFGLWTAAVAGAALAVEPYLVGLSQIAHLDALQALFMLTSLLAVLLYLKENKIKLLVAAGILAGLAASDRLIISLWLLPIMSLAVALHYRLDSLRRWREFLIIGAFIVGLSSLTFVVLWPAVWVYDDLQYSFGRDITRIVVDEHVALSTTSDTPINPASFYVRTVLSRVTPLTLILAAIAFIFCVASTLKFKKLTSQRHAILVIIIYSLGFLVAISLAAKKADRYALPGLIIFPLLAGWVIPQIWRTLPHKLKIFRPSLISLAYLTITIIVTLSWQPYSIAYNNPFFPNIRPLSQQGWGEGLDQAARWLNDNPLGEQLTIASWYQPVTETYFKGTTMTLSSRDDYRVGYVVTYRNMGGRAGDSQGSDVLDEFADIEPVYTVDIKNIPYAWIYKTNSVGPYIRTVGEIVIGVEVGQTVLPKSNHWKSIDIGFATFGSRANSEDVIVHIRENIDSKNDIRTIRVPASTIIDNTWHRVNFKPVDASSGEYYVAITSPTATLGNAVTVRYTNVDIAPGTLLLRSHPLGPNQKMSDFVKEGDMAYRFSD